MEDRHLTLSEVAGTMGVSERTVRRWIKSGKLRAYKPGRDYRIPESAVRTLVEESEISPKAGAPSSQRSLFNGLEEERRETFLQSYRRYAQIRGEQYERRLTEAQEGGVFADHAGALVLFYAALEEYDQLGALLARDLADLFIEDQSDDAAEIRFASKAIEALRPLRETLERISDRAAELAETEAQKAEAEMRREEMRAHTERLSA
jgi:excisionase family DNA binding protein